MMRISCIKTPNDAAVIFPEFFVFGIAQA